MLRSLGWNVRVRPSASDPRDADFLVALHARKSARAILSFRRAHPTRPILLVLTGTDVYRDLGRRRIVERAMEAADAIVTLQSRAIDRLAPSQRRKAFAVIQSVDSIPRAARARRRGTRFCVLAHLRVEKDPLRALFALRLLPAALDVEVVQAGGVLDRAYLRRVEKGVRTQPRYRFLGELARSAALRLLAGSDALVLSSRMEGGANVASEAIAAGIPVLASRIDGNVGILGARYSGYYATGSTRELAALMQRFAEDRPFARKLQRQIAALRPLVVPQREREGLQRAMFAAYARRNHRV